MLKWDVENETNLNYYGVQHSTDGKVFEELSRIPASGKSSYSFLHLHPAKGINYYRLNMMDNNNTYRYSNVRQLTFADFREGINLAPNPAQTHFIVTTTDPALAGTLGIVSDAAGKEVTTFPAGQQYYNCSDQHLGCWHLFSGAWQRRSFQDPETIIRAGIPPWKSLNHTAVR